MTCRSKCDDSSAVSVAESGRFCLQLLAKNQRIRPTRRQSLCRMRRVQYSNCNCPLETRTLDCSYIRCSALDTLSLLRLRSSCHSLMIPTEHTTASSKCALHSDMFKQDRWHILTSVWSRTALVTSENSHLASCRQKRFDMTWSQAMWRHNFASSCKILRPH